MPDLFNQFRDYFMTFYWKYPIKVAKDKKNKWPSITAISASLLNNENFFLNLRYGQKFGTLFSRPSINAFSNNNCDETQTKL